MAIARQSAKTVCLNCSARVPSPAMTRVSNSPRTTLISSLANLRASAGVRTLWSRDMPVSQIGYQILSARGATAAALFRCSSNRSISLPGASSCRPYPPTATKQRSAPTRPIESNSPFSHSSVSADKASRRPGPNGSGRRTSASRSRLNERTSPALKSLSSPRSRRGRVHRCALAPRPRPAPPKPCRRRCARSEPP